MAAKGVSTHGERTCTVEVTPSEVDAGAELTVTVRAACPHGCELTGQSVLICSEDGSELASSELNDEIYATPMLRAPLEVGGHVWRAVLAAHEANGVRHDEAATEFTV